MSRDRHQEDELVVHLPNQSPVLTLKASRILLGILINLSKSDASDEVSGREPHE